MTYLRLKLTYINSILKFFKRYNSTSEESKFSPYKILQPKTVLEFTDPRYRVKCPTRYGGSSTVTVIPGAGIGAELWAGVKEVLIASRAPIVFEEIDMKPSGDIQKCNDDFAHGIISIRRNGVALKGSIEGPACDPTGYSRNMALRRNLDLYANLIQYKTYPGVDTRHKNMDLVIVRQNTEGEYMMLEHEPRPGVVELLKIVTARNSERTARFAFKYAVEHGRKSLLCVDRRDIWPIGDGMFTACAAKVAAEFPQIRFGSAEVESVVKRLTKDPHQYDVLLFSNLAGSLVTNIMLGCMGSPALVSGRNYGDDVAVFETGHRGKGESMTGKGIANPTAMLNAAVDMLYHLGHKYHATLISEAVDMTINVDKVHTFDLGGTARTDDVIFNVIGRLADVKDVERVKVEEIRPAGLLPLAMQAVVPKTSCNKFIYR